MVPLYLIRKEEVDMAIKLCVCDHKYQDKKYGKNLRVQNLCAKDNEYRCTVCGRKNK